MDFEKWFETLLDEKGIEYKQFEIEYKGFTHFVELDFLKEFIFMLPMEQKKAIQKKLVQIDFHNGDILHFLQYLAEGYIKMNY